MYTYGEEVKYEKSLLTLEDYDMLQAFWCGNQKLDQIIHTELLDNDDGLAFKIVDMALGKIIAIVSLASSGIIHRETNYSKLLPAIKIDIFAVDIKYQKMHYNEESKKSLDSDDHMYLSDKIMATFLNHCYHISEAYALVQYIILYADRNAYRFYERTGYSEFLSFMEQEHNQEIKENIPMFLKL